MFQKTLEGEWRSGTLKEEEARQAAKVGKCHRKRTLAAVGATRAKQLGYSDPGGGQPWALSTQASRLLQPKGSTGRLVPAVGRESPLGAVGHKNVHGSQEGWSPGVDVAMTNTDSCQQDNELGNRRKRVWACREDHST